MTAPALVVLAAGLARRYGGCKPLAPVGPHGEAVIDLLVSDAVAAGFGQIVLVLHPETGPAIRYHVDRCWPAAVEVACTTQRVPLGTTHAALAAQEAVGPDRPFAIVNADDVYGFEALAALRHHLVSAAGEHALVGFALQNTVVTDDPVTRGVCQVGDDGLLAAIDERRQVSRVAGGTRFRSDDGRQPAELDGSSPVSVNLWGFQPVIWDAFGAAMVASGLDEEAILAEQATGTAAAGTAGTAAGETAETAGAGSEQATPAPPKAEVLLPEVVGSLVAQGTGLPFRVLATNARCIGVTHPGDLPVVQAELARQVARGIRPERLWESVSASR